MSLSRALIMDLFNRYPQADTIEEAVDLHSRTLKAMVDAKWAELAAAEKALTDFQTTSGAKVEAAPAPMNERPSDPPPEAKTEYVYGHAMRSRIRPGTELKEFLYSDYKYVGAARRLNLGVMESCGRRVWLTRREAGIARRFRTASSTPIVAPEVSDTAPRRRRSFVMRDERLRVGTALVERRYRSGEYIAYADLKKIGTMQGDSVWLTDVEIAEIRKVCQERKRQRDGS